MQIWSPHKVPVTSILFCPSNSWLWWGNWTWRPVTVPRRVHWAPESDSFFHRGLQNLIYLWSWKWLKDLNSVIWLSEYLWQHIHDLRYKNIWNAAASLGSSIHQYQPLQPLNKCSTYYHYHLTLNSLQVESCSYCCRFMWSIDHFHAAPALPVVSGCLSKSKASHLPIITAPLFGELS